MSCTILHSADLYLDMPFTSPALPPEVGSICRRALRSALTRLVDIALEKQVDAVTVAGNLFVSASLHPETLRFLHTEFERLGTTPVYIAPGRVDRMARTSPYLLWRWPANVTVFSGPEITAYEIPDGVHLHGAAVTAWRHLSKTLDSLRLRDPAVHLLLAHAPLSARQTPGSNDPPPIDFAKVGDAGVRLVLSGGSANLQILPTDKPILVYPGSPEAIGFECNASGGPVLVHVGEDQIDLTPLDIRQLRFTTLGMDAAEFTELEELRQRIKAAAPPDQQTVLRLRLTGYPPPPLFAALPSLVEECSADYLHLDFDLRCRPGFDLDAIANQPSLRGGFVRRLLGMRRGSGVAQRRIIDDALDAGLLALDDLEIPYR